MDTTAECRARPRPIADDSPFDVVPPAYLAPPDSPIRGGSRTDAAVVVDRELVKLAGMDARSRLVQAQLVRRFVEMRGWNALGFVRLSDYARERAGCAARTLEEDARVLKALDGLPQLRTALEAGDISWTQARLLSRVATASNETGLLERAATLTTRDLELLVRSPDNAVMQPDRDENSEPELRWSIEVSPRGKQLWRSACEVASRAAGSPLTSDQVLELIVAETASGEPDDTPELSSGFEEHETRLLRRAQAGDADGRSLVDGFLAETGVAEGFPWLDSNRREPGPAEILTELGRSLDSIDAHEIDCRLREVRLVAQRVDYQLATLLRIAVDRRLFREIGFATTKLYVEARLGICARRIWSLLAIERASWRRCKALREAFREGRLSHLAACTLLPVVDHRNGDAWIRRAGEVTLRRLADEVSWALEHADYSSSNWQPFPPAEETAVPVGGVSSVDLQEVQMRAHGEFPRDEFRLPIGSRLEFRVPVSLAALVEMQLERYRHRHDARWRTFERLVCQALLEWSAPPRHRDPVFDRDGWRCSVPACSSRKNLHDHHVVFRSQGGGNERDNRITVCAAHHLHGIHAGIVRARGTAPDDLDWELGCGEGKQPVMRMHSDRYAA